MNKHYKRFVIGFFSCHVIFWVTILVMAHRNQKNWLSEKISEEAAEFLTAQEITP